MKRATLPIIVALLCLVASSSPVAVAQGQLQLTTFNE